MAWTSDDHFALPAETSTASELAGLLGQRGDARLTVGHRAVAIPAALLPLLEAAARHLAQGRAVSVVPHDVVLTVGEASDLLGVSRGAVRAMLASGELAAAQQDPRLLDLEAVVAARARLVRRPSQLRAHAA